MVAGLLEAPAIGSVTSGRRPPVPVGAGEGAAALALDGRGVICDCDRAGEMLFNYRRSEMVWHHVSMVLPQLSHLSLIRDGQVDPRLHFLSRIGRPFAAATRDGRNFACELFFNVLDGSGRGRVSLIVRQVGELAG